MSDVLSASDLSLPFGDEVGASAGGAGAGGSSSNKGMLVVAILVVAVVVIGLLVKASKPKTQATVPKMMMPAPPSTMPPPPRLTEIPTSTLAHGLPQNAPEPTPFAGFSGRESMYAEYVPGPQYNLAYRQSNSPVKLSMIECKSADMFRDIVITNKKDVVCAFTSAGCGHCTAMKPEFEKAASQAQIPFLIVERGAAGDDLLQAYNIRGFPTILRFRDGQPIGEFKDERTAEKLLRFAQI